MLPSTRIFREPILLNIFHHLDAKDLINCSLVSNRWRNIIFNTPELTRQIVFVITCDSTKSTMQQEFLIKYGGNLQTVKLRGKLSNMRVFRVSLKYLEQVKNIDWDFNGRSSTYYGGITFPNLEVLTLRDVSSANLIAKLFASSKIVTLAINVMSAQKLFTKGFLLWFRSRPLNNLMINGNVFDIYWTLSTLETCSIQFQLRSLVIQFANKGKKDSKDAKDQTLTEAVSRFFQSQKQLEVLELLNVDLRLLSMIFTQCSNLSESITQLRVDVMDLDSPQQLSLKRGSINQLLTTLIYSDKNESSTEHFKNFVRLFPNIKILDLQTQQKKSKDILKFIPENLKHLTVMKIDYLKGGKCKFTATFENLVQLSLLGCFIMNEEWKDLIHNMPNLKKLALNIFILTLRSLVSLEKLEELSLGYGCFKSDLMDQLTDNCRNLQKLVVTGSTLKIFEQHFELGLPFKVLVTDSEFLEEVHKNEMLFNKLKNITLIVPSGVELVSNYDDLSQITK